MSAEMTFVSRMVISRQLFVEGRWLYGISAQFLDLKVDA